MGYFDFLTPDLQDTPVDDAEGRRAAEYYFSEEGGQESPKDVKPYSQRRGEGTSKIFETADKILGKYANALPRQLTEEAEKTRNEVRANPENAAKSVEKFFDKVKPYIAKDEMTRSVGVQDPWDSRYTPMGPLKDKWAPSINFYDKDFLDLENHVRNIRTMQRGPEESALKGQLAQADLQKNLAELQNLRGQLDAVTKDIESNNLPEAVSKRSEEENNKAIGQKQQAAAALADHIRQLEAATKQAPQAGGALGPNGIGTNVGPPPGAPVYRDDNGNVISEDQWKQTHLGLHSDIDSNVKASGRDPKDFRLALAGGAKVLEEKMGIDTQNLKDPVPFSRALLTGLQIFDPQGIILSQLQQDLQPNASSGGGQKQPSTGSGQGQLTTQKTPEEDLHSQNLKSLRDQRRSLYQQLGQTPELQNWFGVLTFIFLSVITRSPSVAASILGISQRQGNLKAQLDMIEKDMHDETFNLKQAQHEGDIARKMAADRALRQNDKADEYRKELMKMYLNHHAILLREAARHPEGGEAYKRLDKDFARYASMESAAHSEMQRADKDRNDPYADDAHKQQAEKDYNKALKDYNFWKTKRATLNATIESMGGGGSEEAGQ